MSSPFHIDPFIGYNPLRVIVYETSDIEISVAEIGRDRQKWTLHFRETAQFLKPDAVEALRVFAAEEIRRLTIIERLTT